MAVSSEYTAFVLDLLAPLGPVSARRMFGGAGVYVGDAMVGLIADETLYLRTDDALMADMQAAGGVPFVYDGKAKPVTMPYCTLPDSALDDPDEALAWARRSLAPAEAAAAQKAAAKARKAARKTR